MAQKITTSHRKKKRSLTPFFLFSVLVIVLIAYFIWKTKPKATEIEVSAISAPVKITSVASTAEESLTNLQPEVSHEVTSVQVPVKTNVFVKAPGTLLLPDGRVLRFKPPAEGQTKKVVNNGTVYECDSNGNFKNVTPPKCFDDPFEERLVGLSVIDGFFVPGFLKGYDQDDVIQVLKRPVVINEDDPDDVKIKKQAVAEMKAQILEYIEQGGTFDEFVDEMAAWSQQERMIKRKGIHRIINLVKEGKIDEARKFKEDIDTTLEAQEFSPITLPKAVHEAVYGAVKH